MSKYCLFLIVIYYLTGGNNSMSRFCKFGKLHVTKGNVDKLLGILHYKEGNKLQFYSY